MHDEIVAKDVTFFDAILQHDRSAPRQRSNSIEEEIGEPLHDSVDNIVLQRETIRRLDVNGAMRR